MFGLWRRWCVAGVLFVVGVCLLQAGSAFAAVPGVEGVGSGEETAATAELHGEVTPEGEPTSCVFEYGTSVGYGHSVACEPASVGSGTSSVAVSGHLEGLRANTAYHWRLAATNGAGTTSSADQTFVYLTATGSPPGSCPDEQARTERNSLRLPDCRAYVMVTPTEKNGAIVGNPAFGPGIPEVSEDGQRVITRSIQCFAGAQSCVANRGKNEGTPYEFEHTSGGWVTHPLAPPASDFETYSTWSVDADTGTVLFSAPVATATPTSEHGEQEVFYGRMEDGELVRIGPLEEEGFSGSGGYRSLNLESPTIATPDLSHIVYFAGERWWGFDHTASSPEAHSLYEYVGTAKAHPLLVGVKGGFESEALVSYCATQYSTHGFKSGGMSLFNPLSESGRTVFFTAEGHSIGSNCPGGVSAPAADQVWARVDGEKPGVGAESAHSALVSGPAEAEAVVSGEGCTSPECEEHASAVNEATFARDANFEGASSDGGVAVFSSEQQLTNNASQSASNGEGDNNLYESVCSEPCGAPGEEPQAKERRLIDASEAAGHEAVPGGPRVQGVQALSSDGSHVYFVAQGVLSGGDRVAGRSPEVQAPEEGQDNLYVYERDESYPEGRVVFVATLSPSDEELDWNRESGAAADVTPDGGFVVFMSHRALTADDTRAEGPTQVYEYDAQAQSLVRVSVGEDGYDDNGNDGQGNATIVPATNGFSFHSVPVRTDPTMSNDGAYVFFRSPIALAPGALNDVAVESGEAQNFYEYHEGQVYLISGQDTTGSEVSSEAGAPPLDARFTPNLLGVDGSGAGVFFSTFLQLVPEDTDTQLDYYDAQVCSESEPCQPTLREPAVCGEGSCQGPVGGPAGGQAPASATFSGAGNLSAPPVVKEKAVLTRAQKLADALRACRAKRNKRKRSVCEARARKRYGPVHKNKKKKAKKSDEHTSASAKVGG